MRLIPAGVKTWLRSRLLWAIEGRLAALQRGLENGHLRKYAPLKPNEDSFAIMKGRAESAGACPAGRPIPPQPLWLGYGTSGADYVESGRRDVEKMLGLVRATGFALPPAARVLDFGCGAGRMVRHFIPMADGREIWGVDISAECISWCRSCLSPPLRFATVTTIPHLPFEDRSFDLIYCGSVFTHIDDLAEAWLLELHRILAPGGRLFLTIHDQHSCELLDGPCKDAYVARIVRGYPVFRKARQGAAMVVIGRDVSCQVFYDLDYFRQSLEFAFDVLSVTQEAYGYQTGIVAARRAPGGGAP